MKHPAVALLWHGWRLSRRWYLLVLVIALVLHFTALNLVPAGIQELPNFREILAPGVVILNMLLASFTTFLAVSLGGRAGFPLRFEYRLPVSTPLLVGVPMFLLIVLCASLYVIPLLLGRLLYGVHFPLLAGAVLIGVAATLLAAGSWLVTGSSARALSLLLAATAGIQLVAWLQPFRMQGNVGPRQRVFDPDMISLSMAEYALLALLVLILYALTVHGVGLQRQGESWRLVGWRGRRGSRGGASRAGRLLDRFGDLLSVPCPIATPWLAELWLETKRNGIAIIALGTLLALLMPLLPLMDQMSARLVPILATAAPLTLFFTGIGIAIFDRRVASGGYMNAFEGTRGLGTLQMAIVQFGVLGLALLIGLMLTGLGLWLSMSPSGGMGPLWERVARVLAHAGESTWWQCLAIAVTAVTCMLALIAFFFCVHALSTFWGRKVMYGALAFMIYAAIFARAALVGEAPGLFVARNMWWLSGITLALTLLLLTRVAMLRVLSLRSGIISLAVWMVVVASGCVTIGGAGVQLWTLPAELKAFNAAMLLLPLTLFLAIIWCYDRLRHR